MSRDIKEIIEEMSDYVTRSGFTVDRNDAFGWVAIYTSEEGNDEFFLENADFEEFMQVAQAYAEEADVDLQTAMQANAKTYIDCL